MSSSRAKIAKAALIIVCAAVLIAICGLIVTQWRSDTYGGLVAKFIILFVWLWASWRLISKVLK